MKNKSFRDRVNGVDAQDTQDTEKKSAKRTSFRGAYLSMIAADKNPEMLQKADTLSIELAAGGKLLPEEAKDFLRKAVNESALLKTIRVETITRPEMGIPKLAINQFIVKRHLEAQELPVGDRSKVDLSQLDIPLIRERVQMDISLDVVEDNIEGEGILDTVETHMFETLGANLSDILLTADTANADIRNGGAAFAAGEEVKSDRDGLIKKAVAGGNVLAAPVGGIIRDNLISLIKTVEPKYRRRMNGQRGGMMFVMNPDDALDLKASFGNRETGVGDKAYLDGLSNFTIEGVPVLEDDNMPAGYVIYTSPLNIVWVASVHNMRVDKKFKPEEGVHKIITRLYYGFDFQEIEGVGILTP